MQQQVAGQGGYMHCSFLFLRSLASRVPFLTSHPSGVAASPLPPPVIFQACLPAAAAA